MAMVEKAKGNACVLAMGTAQPANVIKHSQYPDYYFRVTKSEHMTELKRKFQRICDRAQINQRHVLLTEEMLKQYPSIVSYDEPSHDDRQQIMLREIPRLGKAAAEKAVAEWGQPLSGITHLVFNCTSAIHMPGNDFELARAMGLSPHVERIMLYHVGCHAGGTALRIAKTLAESRRGARVLIVSSEITACLFRGPRPDGGHIDNLVAQVLFGDGAAALIVGADPDVAAGERPCFELLLAQQTVFPDSREGIEGDVTEAGLMVHLLKNVASVISENLEGELKRAVKPLGITDSDWNSLFWISHPGGAAILDAVEAKLALQPSKLRASRHVLAENGNMSSASVLFILEEIRRWSAANGCPTTGEGLPLGVLLGFGPGISVETVVLKAFPLPPKSSA